MLDNAESVRLVKTKYFNLRKYFPIIPNRDDLISLKIPLDNEGVLLSIAVLVDTYITLTHHEDLVLGLFDDKLA